MATYFFFELATTLKNLGAKWLSEKKINFTPWLALEKTPNYGDKALFFF